MFKLYYNAKSKDYDEMFTIVKQYDFDYYLINLEIFKDNTEYFTKENILESLNNEYNVAYKYPEEDVFIMESDSIDELLNYVNMQALVS